MDHKAVVAFLTELDDAEFAAIIQEVAEARGVGLTDVKGLILREFARPQAGA